MNKYFSENYLEEEVPLPIGISGSGGGCFPAGTLVRSSSGMKCIEKLRIGDTVVSYDRFGELLLGYVTETPVHKTNTSKDKLYFVFSKGISLFPKGITSNHAVYCGKTNTHKLVSDLSIGDCLTTESGEEYPVSLINRLPLDQPVHNLIVEPSHTYLVGDYSLLIKVHNGGGGKEDSSPRQAREAKNTLQSSAIAKVLEVYSHGEVVGIVGGAKGVTFNNTALQNPDDSWNFEGVKFSERTGTPSQELIEGFEETEAEVAITPVEILAAGVIEQLPNSNIPTARVTIRLPEGLWRQDKTNGDLLGYQVSFTIFVKERTSGTWSSVYSETIDDKTTSPAEIAYRVDAPVGAVQWDVKVERTSALDGTADKKSVIYLQRITEITYDDLSYPNIAYVGTEIAASSVGNRIPSRTFQVKGLIVQVPDIYDTTLRTYGASYWAGTFKKEWTDNTAWVLYSLITNTEWGLADYLGQSIDVDIFAFFEAALYCDAASWNGATYDYNLLPDGEGGFEVRFRFNASIQVQSDAWQLLQAVASNMNSIVVMKGGQISLIQDRPKVVSKMFNNSNVIDGMFIYSSSQATSRATAVNCTFNDKFDRYLPRTISEEDTAAIAKVGYSVKDIVSFGTVTESQARRACKSVLYNEVNLVDNVAFTVALNIVDIEVGSIISIMDNDYVSDQNTYLSGRVSGISGQIASLDRSITLDAGHTYVFGIRSLDSKSIDEYTISDISGTYTDLTLIGTIPVGDYTNHEFFCYSVGYIEPRLFQVISITEAEKGLYAIFGLFYNPNKFSLIEDGLVVTLPVYSSLLQTKLDPITNVTFEEVFMNNLIKAENHIIVKWGWAGTDVVTYTVSWRRDSGAYITIHDIPLQEFQIPSILPGTYEVYISAVNIQGKSSNKVLSSYAYRTVQATSTLVPPENFTVSGGGTSFSSSNLPLTWTFPIDNELKTDTLLDYVLEIWTTDGLSLLETYIIAANTYRGGSFDYTLALNGKDYSSPSRTVQIKLYSRDVMGDVSTPITVSFTNPSPAAPSFNLSSGTEACYVGIVPPNDIDLTGYLVYRGTSTGFVVNGSSLVYDGTSASVALSSAVGTEYFYRVAAYDNFDKASAVVSAEQSSTTLTTSPEVWVFEDFLFKPNDSVTNSVSWSAGTASKDGAIATVISAGETAWVSGSLYVYYSGAGTVLSATTDLAIAVTGALVLAVYKGGTDLTIGNGKAFVDGGLLLANTVGANQLVVDSAIITSQLQLANAIIQTAHVQDGQITNLKIGDVIQSADYNATNKTGWIIDKTGNLTSFGSIELRSETSGDIILSTGAGASLEWGKVGGIGLPENNATVGAELEAQYTTTEQVTTITWGTAYQPVTFSKGRVEKTSDGTGTKPWTAAAYSSETYGYCRAKATIIDSYRAVIFGLSDTIPKVSSSDDAIAYGISVRDGDISVIESGSTTTTATTFVTNDVLSVTYDDNNIVYAKNGTAFLTRTAVGAGRTFYFDSAIRYIGNSIENIEFNEMITNVEQTQSAVDLIDYTGTTVIDALTNEQAAITTTSSSVDKTAGEVDWDASAYALAGFNSSKVSFKASDIDKDKRIGLAYSPTGYNTVIDFCFFCKADGTIAIEEGGVEISTHGNYTIATLFEIICSNHSNLTYKIGGTIVRETYSAPTTDLFIDTELMGLGGFDNISLTELTYTVSSPPNVGGQLTPSNISVYMANLAVQTAQIGLLAVQTANMGDLSVETLKIADNAVTVPQVTLAGSTDIAKSANWTTVIATIFTSSGGLVTFNISYARPKAWDASSGDAHVYLVKFPVTISLLVGGVEKATSLRNLGDGSLGHSIYLPAGSHTINVDLQYEGWTTQTTTITTTQLTIQETKK